MEIIDSDDDGEQQPEQAEPEPEREEDSSNDRATSHNPFAAFAFAEGGGGGDDENDEPLPAATAFFPTTASATKRPAPSGAAAAAAAAPAKKGKRHACGPAEDFEALGAQERDAVYRKWVGIMGSKEMPPRIDVNTWRFRVLAAVILSSRTQEAMVRQAVQRMATMPGGFSIGALAALDPDDTSPLHERISFVHVNKVKSKHVVLSARRIRDELNGHVPTTMQGLLTMHGIGPTLGPLLVFLFQYHQQEMDEKTKQEEGEGENGADEKEVVVLDDSPVVQEKGSGEKIVAAEEEA